jgi:mono/diheme cytochrome c family protein
LLYEPLSYQFLADLRADEPELTERFGRYYRERDRAPLIGSAIEPWTAGGGMSLRVLGPLLEDKLMRNLRRFCLAFSLLMLVLSIAACTGMQSEPVTQGDAAHGRSLWVESSCVACHGVDARGTLQGPALAKTPLSLRGVINITRRGTPGMRRYPPSQISDRALQDMYAWFQNPVPAVAGKPEQSPWTRLGCGGCHGANAGGGTAPALTGEEPYDEFQRVVRKGGEGMPAFSERQITDAELRWIYDWIQAQAQVPADLQDLWDQTGCGGCHGANAGGGTGPALAGEVPPYDEFRQIVRAGADGMPAYSEDQISDAELQLLHDWLQVQAPSPADPEELWADSGCGACHGADAEGASAPALAGLDVSYDEFERIVREGGEGMPAYSADRISDEALQRLYEWLRAAP